MMGAFKSRGILVALRDRTISARQDAQVSVPEDAIGLTAA